MTLGEFFQWTALHPTFMLVYFIGVPLIALLAGIFSGKEILERERDALQGSPVDTPGEVRVDP